VTLAVTKIINTSSLSARAARVYGLRLDWQFLSDTWNSDSTRSVIVRLVTDGQPNAQVYFDDINLSPTPWDRSVDLHQADFRAG
jgi:hypothetical protein